MLELGLDTFGDVTFGADGRRLTQPEVLRHVVEEGVLADALGLACFGVGEHHRDDFAVSAPEVVLAAIAAKTRSIHLGSAVTVLSSDDPVRVYQRFSTLDALSSGRAEVILGRGSFTESFPLFGYDLDDYERLFEEKLEAFAGLLKGRPVTSKGIPVYPPATGRLRVWIGVGGTPQSIVRAARYGLPLMLAIIGGDPLAFVRHVELYKKTFESFGHPGTPIVGAHSPGYVAATDELAREEAWPHHAAMISRIGRERGWKPMTRADFEHAAGPSGALLVGAPETVSAKIVRMARGLGLSRFHFKYSMGTMPHEKLLESIRLYGTTVAPLVHQQLT